MNNLFPKIRLEDIADVKGGKRLPAGRELTNKKTNYPYIRARDIGGGKIFFDEPVFLDNDTHDVIKNYIVKSGDVCITIVGANVGDIGVVPSHLDGANLTENAVKVVAKQNKFNSNFLKYCLLTDDLKKQMKQLAGGGAAQQKLGLYKINSLYIPNPKIEKQNKISSIILSYDELIENNGKRIKILEEMSQRLYTEWFVKFKFPGYEKVKMVDGLPEGWEVVTVEDLLDQVKRKPKIQAAEYSDKGLFPIVDQGREFIAGYTENQEAIYNEDLIVFGDHTRVLKYCNFSFACGADGTQLLKSNDMDRMPQKLLYYIVVNAGLQNYQYARHFKFLKALKVLKPDPINANNFDAIVSSKFDVIRNLRLINLNLEETRDLLIPQLVTGRREIN